ncbi:cytochrome P450 [Mangrovibrevibacter kandeliae]|uniref:cytochrome P450 n=1 Tax=Mangrovibrevibacter kandeliae TaxID=2968473 RepID=UPI0021197C1B|nr:cytochrome P450 [Aurantimonas sp. CSK15Z-1]MCQ8781540.1 cytochrome P450 [Aurantimonas sp. CSK15Z-1]
MLGQLDFAPLDEAITIDALTLDPYPIYKRLRAEAPVLRVKSVGRTLLTKAADTKHVKDNPALFSSNDPKTPMQPAFRAHTLMRKDGPEHVSERMAMNASFMPKAIKEHWGPLYERLAEDYIGRLPRGETVDIFKALCGPIAARILAHILGIPEATDEEMQRWSQTLMDGAGNFGWRPEPFARTDVANDEMDRHFDAMVERHRAERGPSAFAIMLNAERPIPMSQIYSNIKIAIGGGINEPRDALATIIFGLLTETEQFEEVKRQGAWSAAFEEGVRWVAPIQASSRLVTEDTEIRGYRIPKGDTVMTIQASANHDEELFEHPERYDVFRAKNPHQAFGSGPHHCAGAHIARRTVGQIILPLLFERFPNMTLPDPDVVQWRGFGFRGPINLPVRLA